MEGSHHADAAASAVIRRIGRAALKALAAVVASAQAKHGNDVSIDYTPAVVKSLERGGTFVYRSLNPHGCPWPGRRAACARRTAGKTRRMR